MTTILTALYTFMADDANDDTHAYNAELLYSDILSTLGVELI